MTIAIESPDQPEVIALIAELDAYEDTLYPPESRCMLLKLETGPYQHDALALYASAGYERRGPYADYTNDPLSVFMQKHLSGRHLAS